MSTSRSTLTLALLALGDARARPTHAQLQAHLLAGYSTVDVPGTDRSKRCANLDHLAPDNCSTFEQGTEVAVEFQFYKLESVDLAKGVMFIRSWLRLTWTDPRLAWNVTEWELTSTNIPIKKLWKPDVTVYNAVSHLAASFNDQDAQVYPSGLVFWSRPGNLQVLCRFSGLVNFPHDQLKCQFDVAAWALAASSQGLYPMNLTGYKLPETLASGPISLQSALPSYQAQSITDVSVRYAENSYPSQPDDPFPTLTYTVTLDRNTFFFLNFALLPNVFFSLISLGIMFFHAAPNVEGRISLLLTTLLLVVVEKQTVRAFLPVCGELLWVEMFFWLNFCVTMLVLIESMIVHAIGNSKAPSFLSVITTRPVEQLIRRRRKKIINSSVWKGLRRRLGLTEGTTKSDNTTNSSLPSYTDYRNDRRMLSFTDYWNDRRTKSNDGNKTANTCRFLCDSFNIFGQEHAIMPDKVRVRVDTDCRVKEALVTPGNECTPRKQRLFESMFYKMDVDTNGLIPGEDCVVLLDFCSPSLTTIQAKAAVYKADADDKNGLDSSEFIVLCINEFAQIDENELVEHWELYIEYCAALEQRTRSIWIGRAMAVDRWFRFYLPIIYGLSLIVLYKFKADDGYHSTTKTTMSRFLFDMDVTLSADLVELRHLLWWLMTFVAVFGGLFGLMIIFWFVVAKTFSAWLNALAHRRNAYDIHLEKEDHKKDHEDYRTQDSKPSVSTMNKSIRAAGASLLRKTSSAVAPEEAS